MFQCHNQHCLPLNPNVKETLNRIPQQINNSLIGKYGIKVHYQSAVDNDHSRMDRKISANFSKSESFLTTHDR